MLASVDENDKQMFESKDVEHERQINQKRFEKQISGQRKGIKVLTWIYKKVEHAFMPRKSICR